MFPKILPLFCHNPAVSISGSRCCPHIISLIHKYCIEAGETRFFTLSISSRPGQLQPGEYDPSVAMAIADYNVNLNRNKNTHNSPAALLSEQNIKKWKDQATRMGRGEYVRFWETDPSAGDDEMNYECDANFGSPLEVDCTQIEWNQLTPPSDTLQVGPEEVTFLHFDSCVLAISSAVSLVLRWEQIRAAVAALMNVCIQTPYGVSQGGRAYYRPKTVGGRRKKRESTTGMCNFFVMPREMKE